MERGIQKYPIAPKVNIIPIRTIGKGRSLQRTCRKTRFSTMSIKKAEIPRRGPMLEFISSFIEIWNAGSPVNVIPYEGGGIPKM